ncbi:MAG: YfiR family protein [Bacteroidetes bacterium]|nr:YfiR family protein [Bacteroidota bacterium]
MKKLVLSVALIISVLAGFAQSQNFQTHTLFMYSFTRFVQWPAEESTGDFEIVVLGDSPILNELKAMSEKKKAGSRTIHVSKISSIADFKKGHILYVPTDWTAKYAEVNAKIGESPVLLVTEQAPTANKGCINFVNNKDGRLAFELNQTQMGKHKLRATAELTRMAIVN